MRIVVTSNGADLDAQASPVFGRCPVYLFVDTESMAFEVVENPATGAASGAGIQAAQLVVEHRAEAVVTGSVGPNAFAILRAAIVPVCFFGGGTVREAVDAFNAGALQSVGDAGVQPGLGTGTGRAISPGTGTGLDTGSGPAFGMRRGMGRGVGRGRRMGCGRGRGIGMGMGGRAAPSLSIPTGSREEEIAGLREMAKQLRDQLAVVLDQLDRLEKRE
jgi:predicted Fe-Mo cluster-binding NifX family protein